MSPSPSPSPQQQQHNRTVFPPISFVLYCAFATLLLQFCISPNFFFLVTLSVLIVRLRPFIQIPLFPPRRQGTLYLSLSWAPTLFRLIDLSQFIVLVLMVPCCHHSRSFLFSHTNLTHTHSLTHPFPISDPFVHRLDELLYHRINLLFLSSYSLLLIPLCASYSHVSNYYLLFFSFWITLIWCLCLSFSFFLDFFFVCFPSFPPTPS
jgi:hypothetical protein